MDQPLLHAEVEELKQRLSIKMRQQDALEARLRVARQVVFANRARAREYRMNAIRQQRMNLAAVEQQLEGMHSFSFPAARPSPPTDLTAEGIERNPGPTDDLIRVIILPADQPPINCFVDVPDEEIEEFPLVPSILGFCALGAQVLSKFDHEGSAMVVLGSASGTRVLAAVMLDNFPESITCSNVLSLLPAEEEEEFPIHFAQHSEEECSAAAAEPFMAMDPWQATVNSHADCQKYVDKERQRLSEAMETPVIVRKWAKELSLTGMAVDVARFLLTPKPKKLKATQRLQQFNTIYAAALDKYYLKLQEFEDVCCGSKVPLNSGPLNSTDFHAVKTMSERIVAEKMQGKALTYDEYFLELEMSTLIT